MERQSDSAARMRGEVFLSAGETSGDLYGAALARELRRRGPGIRLAGFGGEAMAAAGVRTDRSLGRGAIVGWTGVAGHLGMFLRLLRRMRSRWRARPPAAVVLIDYPGFNLRLGAIARRLGIPAYYYVCPQVWAWAPGRLLLMRRILRRAFLILPFEQPLYRACGVRADYVGHPILEILPGRIEPRGPALRRAGLDGRRPLVALLPGSRGEEVRRHLPVFLAAARAVAARRRDVQWAAVAAPGLAGAVRSLAGAGSLVRVVSDPGYAVRAAAGLAWTASGTSTLELGLLGVPQIVTYRGNWLNWMIARRLVRVPYVSLVNLILGRRAVPEYLQGAMRPDALAAETFRALRTGAAAARSRDIRRELERLLSPGRESASETVARAIIEDVRGSAGI